MQLKSLQHKSIFKNFNVRWDYSRSQSWFLLRHSDGRVRILHKEHESMDPSCLVSTVQAGGGGLMVWGIFSWHTLGPLVPIEYTQRIFSVWPLAQAVVGEMEMHSVANLAALQTPLATFFPSKKCPNHFISENRRYCCMSAKSCCPSARTQFSLSLWVCIVQREAERGSTFS